MSFAFETSQSLCFSLWAVCSVLYLLRKKAQLHRHAAWIQVEGGQRRGDEQGTNGVLCWSLLCTSKKTPC